MARQFQLQRDKMAYQIGRAETALGEAKRLLTKPFIRTAAAREQIDEALVQLAEAFVPIEYPADETVNEPDDRPEWELRTGFREEDFA